MDALATFQTESVGRPFRWRWPRLFNGRTVLLLMVLCASSWGQPAFAQSSGPKRVSTTATLSILAGTVQHVPAGGTQPKPAVNGMNLNLGDRVTTGPKSTALITFLEGSTLTVQPESDVAVTKADIGKKSSKVKVQINVGTVWARVVRLVDPDSSFSLESNTATATVHDGLIGGQQNADGTFSCWTRTQGMMVTDKTGRTVVLLPGEKTMVKEGHELVPQAFLVNQSVLHITVPPGFLPLIVMPDQARVAGFVERGVEVNQVFGSLTSARADGSHIVEVPAGLPGPYVIQVEALQDGPVIVKAAGSFKGAQAYQLDLSVIMRKGERVKTEITQQMDETTAAEPKTSKVLAGAATPWRPLTAPLPGTILLSPAELGGTSGE